MEPERSLRTVGWILSGPTDLETLSTFNFHSISSRSKMRGGNKGEHNGTTGLLSSSCE